MCATLSRSTVDIGAQELGRIGEKFVLEHLRAAGISVRPTRGADLIATIGGHTVRIEVKTSRYGKGNVLQACTYKAGRTDAHKHSDVVIVIGAVGNVIAQTFVIPSTEISTQCLKISRSGKYQKFAVSLSAIVGGILKGIEG